MPYSDLDRLIDEALRTEPLQPVPLTLTREVEQRVQALALAEQERRRSLTRLVSLGGVLVTGLIASAFLIMHAPFGGYLWRAVPGGMGYADYLHSMLLYQPENAALPLGAAAAAAGIAIVVGIYWLRPELDTGLPATE